MEEKEERISRIRDMKSELILDAALKVFSRKGVTETTLEDIGQEAGFSKASLYNYYPNKETIYFNLALREWENFMQQLSTSPEYSVSPEQDFRENMRRYLNLKLKFYAKQFHFLVSVNFTEFFRFNSGKEGNKSQIAEFVEFKDNLYKQTLFRALVWAKEKNEIILPFEELSFCRIIGGMIMGVMHEWIRNEKVGDFEKMTDKLVDLIIKGVGVKKS